MRAHKNEESYLHKNLYKSFPSSNLFSYVWDRNVRACQNLGVAPEFANARPRAAQNLLMPHSRDSQGRKMLHSYPGGMGTAGIDWCINKKIVNKKFQL